MDLRQTNLEWQTFNGSLPNGAVSIYNDYYKRTDYVSKYGMEAGFYNPGMGPYCHYPYGEKELLGSPFEILVNKGNIEILEWKDDSWGSVPPNSVYTSPNDIYVGKNDYGLGKVHVKHQAFFLPYEGRETWYKSYQVLTVNRDVISEDISDVRYKTDGVRVRKGPPETIDTSVITNEDCREVTGTVLLSAAVQDAHKWDHSYTGILGIKTTITAGIPCIGSTSFDVNTQFNYQYVSGTTHTETKTHSLSVQPKVPPNHSCTVTMVGHKYQANIPYTARLSRTYSNGKTTRTSISGIYSGVQMGKVQAVVHRCEPLPNARPCPMNQRGLRR